MERSGMSNNYGPRIVTDGLICCLDAADLNSYPGTGNTWTDLSGNSKNGTIDAAVAYSSNQYSGAFLFDNTGDDEKISLPKIITTTDFTVCQFINQQQSVPTDVASAEGWIFEQYEANDGGRFIIDTRTDARIRLFIGGTSVYSSTTINNDQNYFICCSRDTSSGSVGSIYVNGLLDNYGNIPSNTIANITCAIGGSRYFLSNKQFGGYIYTTHVYNRALKLEEIQNNYNALKGRFGL